MDIKFFNDEIGLISSFSDLYYATASKKEFNSIEEFKDAFIYKQPISLNSEEIINFPLTPHSFCERRSVIISGVEERVQPVFEHDIHKALLLADEWNTQCILAELDEMYVGYLWETGV